MTLMEFFGCTFLAFGPPLAMFTFTISKDPIRIIILIDSAFFWLLSLLLSSLLWSVVLWIVVVPLRSILALGLVFSVVFQELFRWLLYAILRRAEGGLMRVSDEETHVKNNRHVLAYVSGMGFGVMSGAFSLVDMLADAVGPGTMELRESSENFLLVSAATTLCFIFLHTFWGVIFFSAMDHRRIWQLAYVVGSHLFVSCLTLLNQNKLYAATLIPAYGVLLVTMTIAFRVAGGTWNSLQQCIMCKQCYPTVRSDVDDAPTTPRWF